MLLKPELRTIENIVSTDMHGITADTVKGKKLFQLVKYVTGQRKNSHFDYLIESAGNYYGYESYHLKGKRGFIRVTLEPLFEVIR